MGGRCRDDCQGKETAFSVYFSKIIPAAWRLFNDAGSRVLAV